MFQTATPDTRLMQDHGLIPTTILLDGEYVQAPESPGLHARNRLVEQYKKQFTQDTYCTRDWNNEMLKF